MSKRAVLYARVSGDDRGKDGRNLDGQIEMCRGYALGKGYQVVRDIKEPEEGASGILEDLPGLVEVRRLARALAFDVLIAREVDRLSRSVGKLERLEEELAESDVQIEYVLNQFDNTPSGEFMRTVQVGVAKFERSQIIARSVRGRQNKVKSGQVILPGRVAFGYRRGVVMADGALRMLEPKQRPGPGERATLVPYEPEAETVRQVFAWCVEGDESGEPLTLRAIARKLEGVPTYADMHGGTPKRRAWGVWSQTNIYEMLRSETYAGLWHFGRRNPRAKKNKNNPPENILSVEVPAIVERSTWEAAQKRLRWNREHATRNRKRPYLLSGLVRCGKCNARAAASTTVAKSGREKAYYRCTAKWQETLHGCDSPYFRVDEVDPAVWGWVSSMLSDPAVLEKGLREYQTEREKVIRPLRDRLRRIDGQIARRKADLERLLDLYLAGDFARDLLAKRKGEIEADLPELEEDRAHVAAQLEEASVTPEQVGLEDFVASVGADVEKANADFRLRRGLLQRLRLEVILSEEDGQRIVTPSFLIWRQKIAIVSGTSGAS